MANLILNRPKIHLVIPDSHSTPEHTNERYDWLGHLIMDIKPDVVTDIGDWWDLSSLSSYDKGKASFHSKNYRADINAGIEAQDRVSRILRRAKKKLPRFVRCLGNHEHRIERTLQYEHVLEGTIGLGDLQSKDYGWEQYGFLEKVDIDGVLYSHYFTGGVMGRPIGGDNVGRALIYKNGSSCTQGHSHLFDYAIRHNANGTTHHGLTVGVYQDYDPPYAKAQAHLWHRGVVIKREVFNGQYDLEWISIDKLRKTYAT